MKLYSGTLLPPIVPSCPFGKENRWGAIQYKNSIRKLVFWKNEFGRAFEPVWAMFSFGTILPPNAPYLFSVGIFWWNRSHTSSLGLIGDMVCSGQNCSGRKLCSILSQKPSRIRFSKKHVFGFNFELNRTSPIIWAKRTRWRDWGQKWPGAKFRPSQKTRFEFGFFGETGPIPLFWA